jgi:hypothetical protein
MRIIQVLNTSKTLKESSIKLGISTRSVYRFIEGYRLKKIEGSWVQIED